MEIPVVARRRDQGDQGQARRQGFAGFAGGADRRRHRRSSTRARADIGCSSGPAARAGRGSAEHSDGAAHVTHRRVAAARTDRSADQPAACVAVGAPVRARARRAAGRGEGQRPQGPHHAGRRAGLRQGRDVGRAAAPAAQAKAPARRPAARSRACCRGRKVDFAKFGEVERKDLSRIKKISGANLHRNWVMIPHVTNHDDADITELEAFRVQLNKENEKARHQGDDAGAS